MKLIRRFTLSLVSVLLLLSMTPAVSYAAWNPFGGVDCGAGANSTVCQDRGGPNPLTGAHGLLMNVTNIIAFIAGFVAVIMIILAGLRMVTAGGSSDDVASARRSLIYAVVGLVIIVLARTIVAFVLSRI